MQPEILVFSERPAATGSLIPALRTAFDSANFTIRMVESGDLRKGILQRPESRIFVLPGIIGEDSAYPAQLDRKAHDDIHDFLQGGKNVVLTICAGTYFMCRDTLYEPAWGPRREHRSIAPLFNAAARGPLSPYSHISTPDSEYSDVSIVPIRFKGMDNRWHKTGICYGNGPALYPAHVNDPDTEILAVFDNIPDNPAAIVRRRFGQGAVYLSGVLPELGYAAIAPAPGLERIAQLMQDLKPHEMARRMLWSTLTRRMKADLA